MPQIADLTVKKNDGTTNVVYTAVVPSAGDRSPALWRSQSVGSAVSHQPNLSIVSRFNTARTARRVESTFNYPSIITGTDGITRVSNNMLFTTQGILPVEMATVDVNEAATQYANLMVTALVLSIMKTGFSAT